jgi:hypothetical protein
VQLSSTVINAVTEIVRENFVHSLSQQMVFNNENSDEAQKNKASENIIKKIQEKVATELTGYLQSKNAFFGFDFGFTNESTEIVQIIDIDIVGPKAEELKKQAAENYKKQNDRANNLADSITILMLQILLLHYFLQH